MADLSQAQIDQLSTFYNRPEVQKFGQALQDETQREGGGAKNAIGALYWASQHYKEFGLTDADMQTMQQTQQSGYHYDPQTKKVEPIDSTSMGVAKFVLGYVAPAIAGGLVAGPLIGAAVNAGVPAAVAAPAIGAGVKQGVSTLSNAGQSPSGSTTGDLLTAGGQAVSGATNTAAGNRINTAGTNISGTGQYYSTLDRLAQEEAQQRKGALQDIYMASRAENPTASPYDPAGPQKMSPAYMSTMSALEKQGVSQLAGPAKYNVAGMPTPQLSQFQVPPPSTLENIGNVAGPALTAGGTLLNMWNRRQPGTNAPVVSPPTIPAQDTTSPGDMGDPNQDYSGEQ